MQETLSRVTELLNRGAVNYTVVLRLCQLSVVESWENSLEACGHKVFGLKAEVGGAQRIQVADLLAEMDGLLKFPGGPGAGPAAAVLNSTEFSDFLDELRVSASELADQAKAVVRFWLRAGHPAYPVFGILRI